MSGLVGLHRFACVHPTGTARGRAALAANKAAGTTAAGLSMAEGLGGMQLMAGTGHAQLRDRDDVLLSVKDLVVQFPAGRKRVVHAVSQVSFDVAEGETLGIVGEFGCGKSTVARAIVRLVDITAGEVLYEDQDLAKLSGEDLRKVRPNLQMIFQDPISSLNPRRRVRDVIGEGLAVWGRRDRIMEP